MINYRKWILKYIFMFLITFVIFYFTEGWHNLFETNSNLKILQLSLILTIGDILYDLISWLLKKFKQKSMDKNGSQS